MDHRQRRFSDPIGQLPMAPILIVDDDPMIRQIIAQALAEEGFPVESASDGLDALNRITVRRPAMVLLDMSLPLMDGFDFAAALHETYCDSVPIVVVTANGHAADDARQVGACGYLDKPFDLERLVATVWQALATRGSHRHA
ncbi:MAG: response regulator [Chloroflexi bacterium]|nr:response regulator [Chloroflexota bacterium]